MQVGGGGMSVSRHEWMNDCVLSLICWCTQSRTRRWVSDLMSTQRLDRVHKTHAHTPHTNWRLRGLFEWVVYWFGESGGNGDGGRKDVWGENEEGKNADSNFGWYQSTPFEKGYFLMLLASSNSSSTLRSGLENVHQAWKMIQSLGNGKSFQHTHQHTPNTHMKRNGYQSTQNHQVYLARSSCVDLLLDS